MFKLFGREPESFDSYTKVILSDLAEYPASQVLLALKTHSMRSQEPPTTADLAMLIRRKGKPPLKESDIIAIRKKDGEHRTSAEWEMLREWEAQQSEGWDDFDPGRERRISQDNIALRKQVQELKEENRRLAELLNQTKVAKGLERPKPSEDERIRNTIFVMRESGASEGELVEFLATMGIHASYLDGA